MFRVVPYLVYSDWEGVNDNGDPNVMNWEYYNDRYSTPIFEASWNAMRYLNSRGIRPVIALMGPVPEWMLADTAVVKLMHFARFDVAMLQHSLGIVVAPTYCTKIAAKLVRTFTDRHGLRDLCRELLGVEISKQQQTSDWGAPELTSEQLAYAASDVMYLHPLWARLEALLIRENRLALAEECFAFLPARCELDLLGYEEPDIYAHRG